MAELTRGGAQIHYETAGQGPPLLMIAGIASDVASWAPVVPLLEKHFNLVLFDNRGAGRTQHEGPIDADDWVADAIALLDHLGIGRASVVGHSLGGMIAMRLAQRAPERVEKLVLAATAPQPDNKSLALMRELSSLYSSAETPQQWFRLLFQWLFAPGFFEDSSAVEAAADMAVAYPYRQSPEDFIRQVDALATLEPVDLGSIDADSLVLLAELDAMVAHSMTLEAFSGLNSGSSLVIPSAGHSLHWDRPQAFADAVIGFAG